MRSGTREVGLSFSDKESKKEDNKYETLINNDDLMSNLKTSR